MNRFCDQLFPGAGFTLDQYGAGQPSDGLDQFKDPLHRASGADDVIEAVSFIQLLAEVLIFEAEVAFLEPLPNHDRKLD